MKDNILYETIDELEVNDGDEVIVVRHYSWRNLTNNTEGTKVDVRRIYKRANGSVIRKDGIGLMADSERLHAVAAALEAMAKKLEE